MINLRQNIAPLKHTLRGVWRLTSGTIKRVSSAGTYGIQQTDVYKELCENIAYENIHNVDKKLLGFQINSRKIVIKQSDR
jgi:hypothetical protein